MHIEAVVSSFTHGRGLSMGIRSGHRAKSGWKLAWFEYSSFRDFPDGLLGSRKGSGCDVHSLLRWYKDVAKYLLRVSINRKFSERVKIADIAERASQSKSCWCYSGLQWKVPGN